MTATEFPKGRCAGGLQLPGAAVNPASPHVTNSRAASIVAAVRARGNDSPSGDPSGPRDLRDAAHEACHALETNLTDTWTRANIHQAITRRGRSRAQQWRSELLALAVEQLVCAEVGVECRTIDSGAFYATMEAIKYRLPWANDAADHVRELMDSAAAKKLAARVLALAATDMAPR